MESERSTRPYTAYLADLTHKNYIVASNVMPLGVGLVASHLLSTREDIDVELFKYPDDLVQRVSQRPPDILGFTNYSWNLELSYEIAQRVKAKFPKTVVVFGGPNYGLTDLEIEDFWGRYPDIDFYIVLEGEIAFARLCDRLVEEGMNVERVKEGVEKLGNAHFVKDGKIFQSPTLDRIQSLDDIPSPYTTGLMDKFFDNVLIPLTHTTRGCPFTCTFCSEGNKYYQKVAQRETLEDELRYIAERRGTVPDLALSDANFGMFSQDADKAQTLRQIRDDTGWPQRLVVSTGKNQKERIVEVAQALDGMLSVAASLQSTNSEILKNIKRSNISLDALQTMVSGATAADSTTYTEIILNLPGDTQERHFDSIRDVTDRGLGVVRMYQLILLPQTELNTPDSRSTYGIETRFRINPRSFGKYNVFGEDVIVTEAEEIAIASRTLPWSDYLNCREFDLTVEIFHNTGIFFEIASLFRQNSWSWFSFLEEVHGRITAASNSGLSNLYTEYRRENESGLYTTREALQEHVRENIDFYLSNLEGTNEISKAKAKAVALHFDEMHELAFDVATDIVLTQASDEQELLADYLRDLRRYSWAKKQSFLDVSLDSSLLVQHDFPGLEAEGFEVSLEDYAVKEGLMVFLSHSPTQRALIESYDQQYDMATIDGLGRILMRANPRKLFRQTHLTAATQSDPSEAIGAGDLSGARVNAYGGFTVE